MSHGILSVTKQEGGCSSKGAFVCCWWLFKLFPLEHFDAIRRTNCQGVMDNRSANTQKRPWHSNETALTLPILQQPAISFSTNTKAKNITHI